MRQAIDQLRKLLLAFIAQRDDMVLLVACPPNEGALMLKLLLDEETNSRDDLYYLVADDFTSPAAYLDAIAGRLKRDQDASLESAGPDMEPLPPVPAACLAPGEAPLARLHAALGYTRGLVPPATGHRIVWGLVPATIANLGDYTALLLGCLPRPKIEPWMRGLRLVVRVPEDFPEDAPLAAGPRVCFRRFIIPPDAAEKELRETAQNANRPDAERIESLLQLSFIDAANGRLPEATRGFGATLAWFQKTKDPGMQALAMIGLGDCSRRAGNIDEAKGWYECAIQPAGEAKQLMSLALIAQHLGAIAYEGKQYEDAADYYDQLVTLKRATTDEDGLVEALLWRGRSQGQAKQAEPALASYEEAMLLCRTFELQHREEECLAQLRQGFEAVGRASAGDRAVEEWKKA